MHRIFVGLIFIALCGLGGWYLANPDLWNNRSLVKLDDTAASSASLSLMEPGPPAVPSATASFIEGEGAFTCSTPATGAVTLNDPIVYRWTDADGQVHFGDEKPAERQAELYDAGQGVSLDYFDLDIDYRGRKIVPFLEGQLSAQATSIYEIMVQLVGDEYLRRVQLNIVIFPDVVSFRQYARASASNDSSTLLGFYSPRTNEAVTFTADDDDKTMEVTRHEATHVIARGVLGALPVWLNEGLAEYFSKLSIRGQLKEVASYEGWPQLARATINSGYPANLAALLNLEHEEWHGVYETNHYALSWALVYFLLSAEPGRQALAQLMQEMAAQYCQPGDSAEVLARLYPGGLLALEREFYAWLRDDTEKTPHTY